MLFLGLLTLAYPTDASQDTPRNRPWRVTRLEIKGNKRFRPWELYPHLRLAPKPFQRPLYSATMVRRDSLSLLGFYRERGYFNASVSFRTISRDSLKRSLQLRLDIQEGPVTHISESLLEGPYSECHEQLSAGLRAQPGEPLTIACLAADLQTIEAYFGSCGRLETRPGYRLVFGDDSLFATVVYTYREVPYIVVKEISVEGLKRIAKRIVTRELRFSPGDTLTLSQIDRSIDNLYNTGLFSFASVLFTTVDTLRSQVIRVKVAEADLLHPNLSVFYDTYHRFQSAIELTHYNIARLGLGARIGGSLSDMTQAVHGGLFYPWFLSLPVTLSSSLSYSHSDESAIGLLAEEFSVETSLGGFLSDEIHAQLTYRREENLIVQSVRDTALHQSMHTCGIALVTEQRDIRFPRDRRHLLESFFEVSFPIAANPRFFRTEHRYRYAHPIRNEMAFSHRVVAGLVIPYGPDTEVPLPELFYLGGADYLRGYREKQVGPKNDGIPVGGNLKIAANLAQVQFPVFRWIEGVVFLDAGALWNLPNHNFDAIIDSLSISDLSFSAGTGLRIDLPVVQVEADLGLKLNPNPQDKEFWALHVRAGKQF